MADYMSARLMMIGAVDEHDQAAIDQGWTTPGPVVKLSVQLASVNALQSQVAQLTTERDAAVTGSNARQAAITAMKAAANADKAADAANQAGDGVLAATGGF